MERRAGLSVIMAALLGLTGASAARADDAADPGVRVGYSTGETELGTVAEGVKFWSNRDYPLTQVPPELIGLSFTQRPGNTHAQINLHAPANATVYALCGTDATVVNSYLAKTGWTKLGESHYAVKGKDETIAIYKRVFTKASHITFKTASFAGLAIAAKDLQLDDPTTKPADTADDSAKAADAKPEAVSTAAVVGPTTQPAAQQASIQALEIYRTDSGMMLGQTSEVTLTITPGSSSRGLSLTFATPAGHEMELARDEAMRFLRLTYPNWYADKAELSFEDKYVNHDGGSIGTALGTLLRSVIEGFSIDPSAAMTGDISANGKVRAIGGLAAKLKGAAASKCTLAAVPTDNYDQLVDGVVYNGPALVTDIQVIGIATLADAVATARVDRTPELKSAMDKFDALTQAAAGKPAYFKTKAAQAELAEIIRLAPQHDSAKILLAYGEGKLPKTLSAAASYYYVSLATQPVMGVLKQRDASKGVPAVPSASVRAGLADLRKLRPLANEGVRPLLDAWVQFISAVDALQQHEGSQQTVERQRQILLDEMTKEQADADMMQKLLKEGM